MARIGYRRLLEKLRPYVQRTVNDGANCNAVRRGGVEDQMGLKAEASIARGQFVNRLPDEGKVGKKPERADQTGMVGVGLVRAEFAFGEVVDVDQVGASAIGKPIFSHGDARQRAAGRPPECRRACRW